MKQLDLLDTCMLRTDHLWTFLEIGNLLYFDIKSLNSYQFNIGYNANTNKFRRVNLKRENQTIFL